MSASSLTLRFAGLFLLLMLACQVEEKPPAVEIQKKQAPSPTESAIHLLIFKEEQQLELWGETTKELLMKAKADLSIRSLPIGFFKIKNINNLEVELDLSNVFYESKQYSLENFDPHFSIPTSLIPTIDLDQITQVIIFPSDSRTGQALKPCFACPHWLSALYGQLDITLHQYMASSDQEATPN